MQEYPLIVYCTKVGIGLCILFSAAIHSENAVSTEDFDRIVGVNIKGTFFCYKYAAIQLIKQGGGGRILGAASIASKKGA